VLSSRSAAPETPSWGEFWPETPIRIAIDPNGNLTQKTDNGHVWDYVWNAENQLIRVCKDLTPPQTCDSDGVAVASFKYDPMERRIEKVAGGTTYSYTYDKEDIAREVRSDGTTRRYVHGPSIDEPLAWENGWGARTYYHADGLGSVVRHTDGDGLVVLDRRYDAWGNLESGQQEPGHAFTGREWDSEASAFYYRARYYDPSIGRFLSEDPIGFSGGLNFYAYVNGRPTTLADPTGLQASCCAVIEGRKKELHCILDAIEKGRPQEECFGGREPRVGGYLTCAGHTPDPIDVDHIRRTNPPCLVQCSIAHEERHAQQCRRHGVDYLAYHSDAAERAAYMVELGCLIKQEREEGCCS
jgi:RHS repeat-associated protein